MTKEMKAAAILVVVIPLMGSAGQGEAARQSKHMVWDSASLLWVEQKLSLEISVA